MSHTSIDQENLEDKCDCPSKNSIPFLDTLLSIKEGKIDVDLYIKETNRNQYLLPSSCHNKQTTNSIPYSLGLRIQRTCTDPTNREIRFSELRSKLIDRDYSPRLIGSAITRARKVPRDAALKKVKKKENKGPVFAVTYDPRLPSLGPIQAKHWRSMTTRNKYLADVFKRPPLIAYKRQNNIRGHLIRAKIPGAPKHHQFRRLNEMKNVRVFVQHAHI